jgi:hypothetical protein
MAVDIRIAGADQLARLSKALKETDKRLPPKLNKAIRTGAKPAVKAAQQAVRTLPVRGTRGGGRTARQLHAFARSKGKNEEKRRVRARRGAGLRDTIARAVKVQIKTGAKAAAVRIVVDEKLLPPDQRSLPRHLDSAEGWRKPTFGHDPWTKQYGRPWFASTIRKYAGELRTQILAAMKDIADDIERTV